MNNNDKLFRSPLILQQTRRLCFLHIAVPRQCEFLSFNNFEQNLIDNFQLQSRSVFLIFFMAT